MRRDPAERTSTAPTFSTLATIATGGRIARYLAITSTDVLIDAVRDADAAGQPMLILGGGSNLVVADDGFAGTVIHVRTRGVDVDGDLVTVEAGEEWDEFVAAMLAAGRGGLVPLSGIPGTVGATPIQNVGAYGATTAQFLTAVTVYDRDERRVRTIVAADCAFGNRTSIFKRNSRFVVLQVTFRLPATDTVTVAYEGLAQQLDVAVDTVVPAATVREAVLDLRRSKGMVIDPTDPDTRSVGSFFVNPVLPEVPAAAAGVPAYPDAAGVKLSAAWLIEQAGFARGYGADFGSGRVRLSGKHTLAITNRADATTAEVMAFASHIRDGVWERFGVELRPECDFVGCALERTQLPVAADLRNALAVTPPA
ncbi:UDP-N-acetylmuramate dehydrogenase [Mycolicibacter virginiensis]|uniref:UDP-N-acetylmuramate dehydrogenase n=1 Tax=Mycolicibacter virginiensis TaxID=1795032 RepID=UPI001F0394FD|nr:UDP-N-acetylmuramate dehydrogenase [Mycolicibacter virginiensis]ULP45905.1 UDP-N-acetylmuramate dehydrogenase [Mycolicibacter virginiensis]